MFLFFIFFRDFMKFINLLTSKKIMLINFSKRLQIFKVILYFLIKFEEEENKHILDSNLELSNENLSL